MQVTGYTELVKHLNSSGQWDNTYDFPWYGNTLNVTIATYSTTAVFGDPVYAQSFTGQTSNVTASSFSGYGTSTISNTMGAFIVTYSTWNPTQVTYTSPGSSWDPNANNGAGAYVNSAVQGSWNISGGGASVIYDYGKLIKINSGSGFAAAELNWLPSTNTPPPGCPGANGFYSSGCQYCIDHPNDPNCP